MNNDIAAAVNVFMEANAPTIPGPSPMAYDLISELARHMLHEMGASPEHVQYALRRKYSSAYDSSVIEHIVVTTSMLRRVDKPKKKPNLVEQPVLLAI